MDQQVMQSKFSGRNSSNRLWHWMSCLWITTRIGHDYLVNLQSWSVPAHTPICLASCHYGAAHVAWAITLPQYTSNKSKPPFQNKLLAIMSFVLSLNIDRQTNIIYQWRRSAPPHYEQPCSHYNFYNKHLSKGHYMKLLVL